MNNGLLRLVLGALSCLLLFTPSLGCSLAVTPITKFEPTEFVFTGKVIGFVGPIEAKEFRSSAWGLQIKVVEGVQLPAAPADHFEVFPFELGADCSMMGTSKEELAKYYPIGAAVKVIGTEAKLLPAKVEPGNIRLEILPGSWSEISRNYDEDGKELANAHSIFDYKSFRQISPAAYFAPFMPFLEAKAALPGFELRKDLLRLSNAKSEAERIRVLERLIYYPACCDGFSYDGVAETYIKNLKLVKALSGKREAWVNRRDPAN